MAYVNPLTAKLSTKKEPTASTAPFYPTPTGQKPTTTPFYPTPDGKAPTTPTINNAQQTVKTTPIPAPVLKTDGKEYNPAPPPMPVNTQIAIDGTANVTEGKTAPPTTKPPSQREQIQPFLDKVLGRNVEDEKAQARKDADLMVKQEEANRLQTELKSRKRAYEEEIDNLAKNNPGSFAGIQDQQNDLRRKANKELADIAIQAEFAVNNYQGAEKILNAQIADIQESYQNDIKNFQLAESFIGNFTAEEQAELDAIKEEKKRVADNEEYRARADFDRLAEQSDPLYKAKLYNEQLQGQKLQMENQANSPGVISEKAQTEALSLLSLTDEILQSPYMGQVFGLKNPFTYYTPGSNEQIVKNQVQQLKGNLSLENREKLKGSGAVSDFEFKVLSQAASALNKNLSNVDAEKELKKIKGVFQTAAGLPTTVKIKDPSTGKSVTVQATRETINQAIIDGAVVEYQ